jgi:hypothetical protein
MIQPTSTPLMDVYTKAQATLVGSLYRGVGDYTKARQALFAGEAVDTIFVKIRCFEVGKA